MRLKFRLFILISVFFLIIYVLYLSIGGYDDLDYLGRIKPYLYQDTEIDSKPIVGQHESDPRHQFWDKIFDIFDNGRVDLKEVSLDDAIKYTDKENQIKGSNTKSVLLSKADINQAVHDELKTKHALVKSQLPKKLDKTSYTAGSNGIVLIGGGKFSWLSYLSLLSIRKAGAKVPVEIIMPQHDDFVQEREFCTEILSLNAACVVLPDVLGASVMNKWSGRIANYQFKSLALMVSSFQNVLLLDSDNIILQNADLLFASKLFKTHGMVTWPDYWERTISPVYYDIAEIPVNDLKRIRFNRFPLAVDASVKTNIEQKENEEENVPYHDLQGTIPNLSTESGQFLINKESHACTLLLSMYYNMLGPKLYYKLFSLGEQGEGDKDTFPAAAFVCKDKFYQVKSFIKTLGYLDDGGKFQGVAMGQKSPLSDYDNFEKSFGKFTSSPEMKASPIEKQIEHIQEIEKEFFSQESTASPLFTIHCNYPKLDPINLMSREDLFDPELRRLKYRLYGGLTYDDPVIKNKVLDFELEQWRNIDKGLCESPINFVHFKKSDVEEICLFVKGQLKFLQSS